MSKTTLSFEDVRKPSSKLSHTIRDAPGEIIAARFHREVRESEQENVGVESAHKIEETAETVARVMLSEHRRQSGQKTERQKSQSRWQQKRTVQREQATPQTGRRKQDAAKTSHSAQKTAERIRRAKAFFARHKKGFLITGIIAAMAVLLMNVVSSCSVLFQGGISGIGAATYPSADGDLMGADAAYSAMEDELRDKLDQYEATHSYHEYHYELDEIEHDPYVLLSLLTAFHGDAWTLADVQDTLRMLFEQQYVLTETVTSETRYRTETRTGYTEVLDPYTGEVSLVPYPYDVQVPYTYYICSVKLVNADLSHLPAFVLSEEQLAMYSAYMSTLGNRSDLFPDSEYVGKYITNDYIKYDIPPEALADTQFAAMIEEAEKYLGYPYVWCGSSPETSFDCSGFVSWVVNHSGWDVGRLTAQGLFDVCTPVTSANVMPGDLVFFKGTYNTSNVSHVGIYVGDHMMLHCGDPISYADLSSNYYKNHFYAYGRLPIQEAVHESENSKTPH